MLNFLSGFDQFLRFYTAWPQSRISSFRCIQKSVAFFRIEVDRVSFYHFFFPILFWFILLLIQSIDSTSFLSVARPILSVRPYNCSLCCCGYCTSSTSSSLPLFTVFIETLFLSVYLMELIDSDALENLVLGSYYTKVWCVLPFFVLSSFYNAQVQATHQTFY